MPEVKACLTTLAVVACSDSPVALALARTTLRDFERQVDSDPEKMERLKRNFDDMMLSSHVAAIIFRELADLVHDFRINGGLCAKSQGFSKAGDASSCRLRPEGQM